MEVVNSFTREDLEEEIRKLSTCGHEGCNKRPRFRVQAVDMVGALARIVVCADCACELQEQFAAVGGRCLFIPLPNFITDAQRRGLN